MTALPVAHNGQTFDLAPTGYAPNVYRLMVERDVDTSVLVDGEWDYREEFVSESLGVIEVDRDGNVMAVARNNGTRAMVATLNEAVAFLVDVARPCEHGDAVEVDAEHDIWECEGCSALFGHAPRDPWTPQVLRFHSVRGA